jgi:glycerol-3-phosphate dehydrogenase
VPGGEVSDKLFDIAIIGGGVNGCGIARDAVGRGLSVYLAEKDDLASGTSSASTKLIHGGLRYLEHYEFRLVRESLREREVLWGMAPHIIHPMRFVLPHAKNLRPAWLIRLGLFLYDHIGGRERLPGSHYLNLSTDPAGAPLHSSFTKGFEYSDCRVDDSRLVVLNAVDAKNRGATIRTRTEVITATRQGKEWRLEVLDVLSDTRSSVRARILINATGPWIGNVISDRIAVQSKSRVRLVKGSHIVVPRMFDHDRAYIFQNPDQRIIFAIPYEQDFTLVGTTDMDYSGPPESVEIQEDEIEYLCTAIGDYFAKPIKPAEIVWSFSGIRPLYDDGVSAAQEATRDYVLEIDGDTDRAIVLNVFGGKITTYRHLAEDVLTKLDPWLDKMKPAWTRGAALPGGDFAIDGLDALVAQLTEGYSQLPAALVRRLVHSYGTLCSKVLDDVETEDDLGRHFGAGLYQREVEYLIENEWALSAQDILWRRSKLGLRMNDQEIADLASWLKDNSSVR